MLCPDLDQCPVYGYYRHLSEAEILARIDWVILKGYLAIVYDYRLPRLVYTPIGWEIEKATYAGELLRGFGNRLAASGPPFETGYLKDKSRDLVWLLLDKVEATGDKHYTLLLEAWEQIDYKNLFSATP